MDAEGHLDRRSFLAGGSVLGLAALAAPLAAADATDVAYEGAAAPPAFPRQDPDVVREVVGAAHGRFDRVRELVETRPALAKANVDWGFGDWESALGAAAHTGQREIALFLLAHGARPTLFSAAMLGQLAVVRATVEAHPGAQRIPGPHGIPLLAHARAGGDAAAAVVAYLEALGDAGGTAAAPLADADAARFVGTYDGGVVGPVELTAERGGLWLRAGDGPERGLRHLGGLDFHPAGAEAVRVRLRVEEGTPTLRIVDGDVVVTARRSAAASPR